MNEITPKYKRTELERGKASLKKSKEINENLMAILSEKDDLRTVSIMTCAGFESIFDTIFEFRYRTTKLTKRFTISRKIEIIKEEKIISTKHHKDLQKIFKIRNICAHSIKIDKSMVKEILCTIERCEKNPQQIRNRELSKEFKTISVQIFDDIMKQFSQYISSSNTPFYIL